MSKGVLEERGQEGSFVQVDSPVITKVSLSVNPSSSCAYIHTCTYLICVATVVVNEHAEGSVVNLLLVAVTVASIPFVQYEQIACRKGSS